MDASSEHIEFIRRFGTEVYYGDASRLEFLRAARADRARVFVLATVERFRVHDEALFEASWKHQGDLEQLTDIARRGREELERLFEQDAAKRRPA
jgi:hypothetical protein